MTTSLIGLLKSDAVPLKTLHERYGSLLELVRKLIGVVPNCDPYLEIWPPAFRSYNLMVPNFLNLPFLIWGFGAPKEIIGLALYVSSRTAECNYCSAHTCSFALRRGQRPDKVARALEESPELFSEAERAVIAVAKSLARIPADLKDSDRKALQACYSPAEAEWIVLGISMMGFLNKFMDAAGVELEGTTIDEVERLLAPSGWKVGKHFSAETPRGSGAAALPDSLLTKLSIIRYLPSAISLERKWVTDAPDRWPAAGEYLRARTGHDFPLLSRLTHRRAIRAITAMLRDNLDAATSQLGLSTKCLAGIVYSNVIGDAALAKEVGALAVHNQVSPALIEQVAKVATSAAAATDPGLLSELDLGSAIPALAADAKTQLVLLLAHALSPSPARAPAPSLLEQWTAKGLTAPAIVELVTWLSVLQMLHRLSSYYT